jgi:RNA polymerase sigma-70 factor, ECF subfamily
MKKMQQIVRPSGTGLTDQSLDFESFFFAEYRKLGKALYLLTGDISEAEDLAQEAMSRVFERWEQVRMMESPTGYLYRIAMNVHRRRWRLGRRRTEALDAPTLDPALAAERRVDVARAVAALSRDQRQVLVLVEWLGFEPTEAAQILGVEPGTVRTRLHRARRALMSLLGEPDE